jgi:uncharacterized protein
MSIIKLFKFLHPKKNKFYQLFEEDAENLFRMAEVFHHLMNTLDSSQWKLAIKQIKEYEIAGDEITIQVYEYLNKVFITPIDRQDIHSLATHIEGIVNNINDAGQRILHYNPKIFYPELSKLANMILETAIQIKNGMRELQDLKKIQALTEVYIQIDMIKHQANDIYNLAVSNLFEKQTNPFELIKLRDIIESVEQALDKAKDVSAVFKAIVSKRL